MKQVCEVLSEIKNAGHEVILVSSGAIGMGMEKLGLDSNPHDLPGKQACVAIGQCELMYAYDSLFSQYNHIVGQILITKADVENEDRKTNFINTMEHLLKRNVLPIVNENDTISTDEIVIGDNDNLGAILAKNIHADLYIILSDIDGLYDDDPHKNENAKLIPVVYELDEKIFKLWTRRQFECRYGWYEDKTRGCQNLYGCRVGYDYYQWSKTGSFIFYFR